MLNRGYWVTTLLSVVGLAIVTSVMMNTSGATGRRPADLDLLRRGRRRPGNERCLRLHHPVLHRRLFRPVREIAEASKTGPATNIISGTAVGFETTLVTAVTISIALFVSYWLGNQANLLSETGVNVGGIFGTPSRRWACS